ncbi:transaldolase family protein [Pseudoleptotrichia goodfellowii]|uniref:Transaldolase n=1 Tax=Pseudoleptotrichia goodfellowii TaxID=157692 RepID=A0A510J9F6_9FUSO|nr:transaldolase family protein [Pseudoleptotrichia goodfellowii]BBM35696.1 transaldolase [Pseudoleptotrichia goodfellowii]
MEYFLDTADIEAIKRINEIFPLKGVTTNPSIIAKEKRDFKDIINDIYNIIGKEKVVHAQAVGSTADIIVKEVNLLRDTFGENIYAKIPVTFEGIKAMKILSKDGHKITATGILSSQQIIMAAEAGAEYMAPYINRSDNIGESGVEIVRDAYKILEKIKKSDEECLKKYKRVFEPKILGASFKNVRQVHETMLAGSKSVTVSPDIFERLIYHPYTDWSMDTFNSDWEKVYGEKNLLDLL